tara:strand:- start:1566 stop:1943 length:378 start_codon:yes stop_codon:yes gene_type:complete
MEHNQNPMKKVPSSLRTWFIIHFIVDYMVGLPLLFFPEWTMGLFGLSPEPFIGRLFAAALLGISGVSLISRNKTVESYQSLLTLKIIFAGSALLGILLSGFHLLAFTVFLVFLIVWTYYKRRLSK